MIRHRTKRVTRSTRVVCMAVAALLVAGAGPAHAAIDSTTGQVVQVSPPASVVENAVESDTEVRAFDEQQGVTLAAPLSVDINSAGSFNDTGDFGATGGVIPAGTTVDSHLLHADPVGSGVDNTVAYTGGATFDADILGINVLTSTLDDSDAAVGAPGTTYPVGSARGLEFATGPVPDGEFAPGFDLVLSDDLRTISFRIVLHRLDQIRVITEAGARLRVVKFYDADADGVRDPGEPFIDGWLVDIEDDAMASVFAGPTPVDLDLSPGSYSVRERTPDESNWFASTPATVDVDLLSGDDVTVEFGNYCILGGSGRTPGFWGNKNGQARMFDGGSAQPELQLLRDLNLRSADGSHFDPASYGVFKTWLKKRSAENMAYQLSGHLAAMVLNLEAGFLSGGNAIPAPGTASAGSGGLATIDEVVAEANAELGLRGLTTSGSPYRALQEALKDALDRANNDGDGSDPFVAPQPCGFGFS